MKLLHTIIGVAAALTATLALAADAPLKDYNAVTNPIFNSRVLMTATPANASARLSTLEVMGIGLSVEMFRQAKVWEELQKHPGGSILPSDLSTYPTNYTVKELASGKRAADTLEYGGSHFVEYWPIPSLSVWPFCDDKEEPSVVSEGKTNYAFFYNRINRLSSEAGMHGHEIASLGSYFQNEPEEILERAFQFFDGHPEAPALLLLMSDGDMTRGIAGDKSRKPYWSEGPRRFDSMAESFVVLVLARRERVDALRPFAWHSAANSGEEFKTQRDQRMNAKKVAGTLTFKPSKYLPEPWSDQQLQQFDSLPTIAVLHRPIRVSYRKDKDGKPTVDPAHQASLMHEPEQQAAFKTAFDAALKEIPGGKPARVFYDTAGPATGRHVVPLSLALGASLPGFNLFNPEQGYDLSARIGNTGAASPFVQWALAAMAGFKNKDAGITVNLRQSEEATITVVTPAADRR